MKKDYMKPEAEMISFQTEELMSSNVDGVLSFTPEYGLGDWGQ